MSTKKLDHFDETHLTIEKKIINIPLSVTHLHFGNHFNQPLKPGDIPNSVTHLYLGHHFNQPLKAGDIPASVTHLRFGHMFNCFFDHVPESVTHLTFGHRFNYFYAIPSSVTHLTFGHNFNQPIDGKIPKHVTHLKFGKDFNQLLNGCIPESVKHLHVFSYKLKRNRFFKLVLLAFDIKLISCELCSFLIRLSFEILYIGAYITIPSTIIVGGVLYFGIVAPYAIGCIIYNALKK